MIKKTQKLFIEELVTLFPEIEKDVLDEDNLGFPVLQIGYFKRFTQQAIDNNNIAVIEKCFQFVDANMDIVEFGIENSLATTWLAKLEFEKNEKSYQLLSPKLRALYVTFQEHYKSMANDKKFDDFLKSLDENNG